MKLIKINKNKRFYIKRKSESQRMEKKRGEKIAREKDLYISFYLLNISRN